MDISGIAGFSVPMSQINTSSEIGVKMLSNVLDSVETSGASMIDMMDNSMELSVNPGVGGNFDMRI